jgi:hypothetical protein
MAVDSVVSNAAVVKEEPATAVVPSGSSTRGGRGRGRHNNAHHNALLRPEEPAVLHAVESLYADRLKPFGRLLRKRIIEQHQAQRKPPQPDDSQAPQKPLEVDVPHLHEVCGSCSQLLLTPEEGGDWSVTFAGRAETFVDIYSDVDEYPEDTLWGPAAAYFSTLEGTPACLPGGRYSCAQDLAARNLPFLAPYSLGEVCHIVQLAISQRKLLGYLNGSVVPYGSSQSMKKEQCAVSQLPCPTAGGKDRASHQEDGLPTVTWDEARKRLREILQDPATQTEQGPSMIPLSNVKRIFRSRYRLDLSETALGHSKLSELLQDERFRDVCTVQLQGNGYMVIAEEDHAKSTPAEETRIADSPPWAHLEALELELLPSFWGGGGGFSSAGPTPLPTPGCPASAHLRKWYGGVETLGHEGRDEDAQLALPQTGTDRRWSVEGQQQPPQPRHLEWCPGEHLCLEESGIIDDVAPWAHMGQTTPLPSPGVPTSTTVRRWLPLALSQPSAGSEVPGGQYLPRCASLLSSKDTGSERSLGEEDDDVEGRPSASDDSSLASASTAPDAPGTPMKVKLRHTFASPPRGGDGRRAGSRRMPLEEDEPWVVRNTFLVGPPTPATPGGDACARKGATRRAHSLPKDLGSSLADMALESGPACFVAASLASIDATPASVAPCNHVPGIPEPGIDSSALTLSAVLKERSGESGHGCRGVTAHIGELRLAELI